MYLAWCTSSTVKLTNLLYATLIDLPCCTATYRRRKSILCLLYSTLINVQLRNVIMYVAWCTSSTVKQTNLLYSTLIDVPCCTATYPRKKILCLLYSTLINVQLRNVIKYVAWCTSSTVKQTNLLCSALIDVPCCVLYRYIS